MSNSQAPEDECILCARPATEERLVPVEGHDLLVVVSVCADHAAVLDDDEPDGC